MLCLIDSNSCPAPFHVLPAAAFIPVAGLTATDSRGQARGSASLAGQECYGGAGTLSWTMLSIVMAGSTSDGSVCLCVNELVSALTEYWASIDCFGQLCGAGQPSTAE